MSRSTNISAQVAAKAAGYLFQGTGDVEGAMKAMARFYTGVITLGGQPEDDHPPVASVAPVAALPATSPAAPLGQAVAQAEATLAASGVQAAVVRDLSTEESRWQDALNHYPSDWYNNVGDTKASSGGGKGPDFRFKDDNADVKSLWLGGKYGPAPAWVFEKLGLQMPGAPAAAPVAPAATPVAPAPAPAPVAGAVTEYGPDEAPF